MGVCGVGNDKLERTRVRSIATSLSMRVSSYCGLEEVISAYTV